MLDHIRRDKFRGERVGVATGGRSAERAISLKTGRAFATALRAEGYEVTEYDVATDLARLAADRPAAVLVGVHGGIGENGVLQGYLEAMGIAYTGSGVLASALAMDKARAKAVLDHAGVQVPGGLLLGRGQVVHTVEEVEELFGRFDLRSPVVAKLNDSGSSFGVFICQNNEEVAAAMRRLEAELGGLTSAGILIEPYLDGPEFTVGFFDDVCLGAIEIVPEEPFYDFQAKYESKQTEYRFVEDAGLLERLEILGRAAFQALGCRGVARVDVKAQRGAEALELFVLEVNTIPGMTETSLIPKLAASLGMDFGAFVEYMLGSADCEMAQP